MNNTYITLALSLFLSVATFQGFAAGEHDKHADQKKEHKKDSVAQSICPIAGGKINKAVYVDHDGKRVYFCCPGCDKKFLENADALIKEMEGAGIKLASTPGEQKLCPVSGQPIDKKVVVEHDGQKIHLCCPKCKAAFDKDPAAYVKKVEHQKAADQAKKDKAAKKDADHKGHDHKGHHHH